MVGIKTGKFRNVHALILTYKTTNWVETVLPLWPKLLWLWRPPGPYWRQIATIVPKFPNRQALPKYVWTHFLSYSPNLDRSADKPIQPKMKTWKNTWNRPIRSKSTKIVNMYKRGAQKTKKTAKSKKDVEIDDKCQNRQKKNPKSTKSQGWANSFWGHFSNANFMSLLSKINLLHIL